MFYRREEEEDSLKIIEKELEKLNIEDSKESTETNVMEGSNDLSGENFSQKLLNTLKEKENSNKKTETFKPYR